MKKDEINSLLGVSKQIPIRSNRKDREREFNNEITRELEKIKESRYTLDMDSGGLSTSLKVLTDPSRLSITDRRNIADHDQTGMFKIFGNDRNRLTYNEVISRSIEDMAGRLTSFTKTGVYAKIQEAVHVDFLTENMPVLDESANLFIDDVNNGTYRGDEYGDIQRFRFYKGGSIITDSKELETLIGILNPKDYDTIVQDRVSFNDIDIESDKQAWKYGYSITRVIPIRKVAMDMYVKYVLKDNKVKKERKKKKTTDIFATYKAGNESKFQQFIRDFGMREYLTEDGRLKMNSMEHICGYMDELVKIAEFETINYLDGKEVTNYHLQEITRADESFIDYLTRHATGAADPIHFIDNDLGDKRYVSAFTFSTSSYSDRAVSKVIESLSQYDSALTAVESVGVFDNNDIDDVNISFERIYNMRPDAIINKSSYDFGLEADTNIANILNSHNNIMAHTSLDIEEEVKKSINYEQINRLFGGLKGEVVEILDNARTIPIMVGDRCLGCLYIEYTHQDIEHLSSMRSTMANPMAYVNGNYSTFIREEDSESTLGKLIFGDIIAPIIEKNIDVNFIRNNSSIIGSLYKLLIENELSKKYNIEEIGSNVNNNLTRISYIPPDEIVFKKFGKGTLGTSAFMSVATPANACILAKEAYLSYILGDGRGYSIVTVSKGLSDITGEEGTGSLIDQFNLNKLNRLKLRDISYNNYELGRKIFVVAQDDDSPSPIKVDNIDPNSDFNIDMEYVMSCEQEATNGVGYNSALFNSMNGEVEMARKLFEMNDSKMLTIQRLRKSKKRASSLLATLLLRYRGGDMYKDINVEWVSPPSNRRNSTTRSEVINEIKDTLASITGVAEEIYADNADYNASKEEFAKIVLKSLADGDPIMSDLDKILLEATRNTKIALTTEKIREGEDDDE